MYSTTLVFPGSQSTTRISLPSELYHLHWENLLPQRCNTSSGEALTLRAVTQINPVGFHRRKVIFFFLHQQVSIAVTSWLGVGPCVHFPLSVLGPSSGLNLCRPCVCCHSFSEVIHMLDLTLFPWRPPSPMALTILLPHLLQSSLSPE